MRALTAVVPSQTKAGVLVQRHYKFVLSAGAKVEERSDEIPPWRDKKCDNLSRKRGKQLTHIVRVIGWLYFIRSYA